MPTIASEPELHSPLLSIFQKQVAPNVQSLGMGNIVVAHSTWKVMQTLGENLPQGASMEHKPLKSKRIPVRGKRDYRRESATLDARWPEDGLHSNRMPILMFVVRGKVAIPLGDYVLHCRPSHGALILPGTPHPDGSHLCLDDCDRETGACEMISIKVMGNGITCWLNHTREGRHWTGGAVNETCHVPSPQARMYLETLAEEAKTRSPYFQIICDSLLRALIALLLREIQELRAYKQVLVGRNLADPTAPPLLQEPNPIGRVEEYVRDHLRENLSIDRVAAYAYMSRAHFTRQFRAATGKTFNQYVTECRLEAAKALLQNTTWSINTISDFVGLTPTRLRVVFQQHDNLTPSEFRRQTRGK